ncbi:hypothetical protein OESDEN_17829 [Oesophagostomum dentatum]|uniref:Uncharacterized protein n=1 Tax=Oesophagostomum dentatum TaxID=61180 RepID=A0A0B1SG14_OESDE|nr:hypothetical protein OESDEN_17829 [Oesophagostomum dentatum]
MRRRRCCTIVGLAKTRCIPCNGCPTCALGLAGSLPSSP